MGTSAPAGSNGATVPDLLASRAAREPDHIAIEVAGSGTGAGTGTLSFADWQAGATAVARGLIARGLRPGDRVGLRFGTPHWIDFAVAYCGVQRAGGAAVPISERVAPAQTRHVLWHSGARAMLHAHGTAAPEPPPGGWTATVDDLAAAGPGPVDARVRPEDLAQILYTSGTTGRPKGVAANHANLAFGAPAHPRRRPLAHSEHFLHAFPIGTNAASTMLLNALIARPTALTPRQFTPGRFVRLITARRVGTVFLVPAMAVELLNSGALSGRDLSSVVLVGSTAAPLAPAIATALANAFPAATIVNYYSSTEAAPAQTTMVFDPTRPDAVGRVLDGSLMIADANGQPLPPDGTGEVWLRSPHPRAYHDDEQASRATFRCGWTRMGDLGRMDADGYLYLLDRADDLIKCGALKVSTLAVEAALHEHPAVAEAAVLGVPHPVLGRTVAAAVVPRPGVPRPTLTDLREFLLDRLADHELPTHLSVLPRLPRNEGGKVVKRELLACFADGAPDR